MRTFTHLSLEEREKFFAWRGQGISFREIGKRLGRSHTTFLREPKRNAKYGRKYIPCRAHKLAQKRGWKQRYKAPLKDPLIFLYVREHLRDYHWSPETIAGRLPIDYPGYFIHPETIYRYIYSKQGKKEGLFRYLIHQRKRRMKKGGRRVARLGRIPGAVSIDLRPKEALNRTTAGHWETDNLEGIRSDRSVVSATVERLTRITHLTKLADRGAEEKAKAITSKLESYPQRIRRTLTGDNGKENSNHQEIKEILSIDVYFCHAYHSWEKGTVENTIGRIRRFIPKGTSVDEIPQEYITVLEEKLNNTPRKCLGFLTPYEKMLEVLSQRPDS